MAKNPAAQLTVARLANQSGSKPLSIAHQPPAIAFLSVRVAFMGEAVQGLDVEFYECKDDGKRGDKVPGPKLTTDEHGLASVKDPVKVGNYLCVIQDQTEDARITTVDDVKNPITIPLPVGRPRRIVR